MRRYNFMLEYSDHWYSNGLCDCGEYEYQSWISITNQSHKLIYGYFSAENMIDAEKIETEFIKTL